MTAMHQLGELITTKKGYAFKGKWFADHGIPVVKATNFTDDSIDLKSLQFIDYDIAAQYEGWRLKNGDVVVQTVGSWPSSPASAVGKCIRVPEGAHGALLNQNTVILKCTEKLDSNFLFYSLRDKRFRKFIENRARGSASQASITLKDIKEFKIFRYEIEQQKEIGAILRRYDDLIENNKRRIALLEESARQLYKEWFVRFRFPGHEHVKFVDGMPEGWYSSTLPEVCNVTYGYAFKSSLFNVDSEGIPVVRIRDIPHGESKTHTSEEASQEKLLKDGDFLVGMDGDFHMNYWTGGKAWLNQRVVKISGKNILKTAFIKQAVKTPIKDLNKIITGTTVRHLGAKHLKQIKLVFPKGALLEQANNTFEDIRLQVVKLSQQNRSLVKARDILLPKLMSGELAV